MKIPGTSKSKFENLFKLAMIVLCIIHSIAEEESHFSHVKKNLTSQRASLSLDGTLSGIISFQLQWQISDCCNIQDGALCDNPSWMLQQSEICF